MEPDSERVLMSLPDILLVFDDTGTIEYANVAMGQLLKRRTRDFFGKSLGDIQNEYPGPWEVLEREVGFRWQETPGTFAEESRRGQAQGYAARDPLAPETEKSGRPDRPHALTFAQRLFTYKTFHIVHANGGPRRVGALLTEISEERKLVDRLAMAAEVAGLRTLAAGVAHELNNPLFTIMGRIEVILGMKEAEAVKPHAEKVLQAAQRMAAVIQNFSNYAARRKEMPDAEVDINERLDAALDVVLGPFDTRGLVIEKHLGELPPLKGFGEEFLMVFMHVIKNAVQAMGAEGQLTLTTRLEDAHIVVEIQDTGPGIPDAYMSRIFEPFFTTKGQGQGAGLGLNTAYRILENYKGSMDVTSDEGKGTRFTMRFPTNA